MAIEKKQSAAESLQGDRTFGKVRCHNPSCMERIVPEKGADHAKCPTCAMEYRIYWVNPTLPRIRGPVWEVNLRLAEEKMAREQTAAKQKSGKKGGN
jgi:hypothetical protein